MTRRIAAALALGFAAGCALVANLGDDARLRDATDSGTTTDSGAPPIDAPAFVDASDGSRGPCGLVPDIRPACSSCNVQKCCTESLACANNPRCVDGIECLKNCAFVAACVNACLKTYEDSAELPQIAQCSGFSCQKECIPSDECLALGECCYRLTDAGSAYKSVCVGKVFTDDPNDCTAFRNARVDAGDCPQ